ncbi:MAG: hypothetical protein RQ745_06830 [Longimicrobiales bacterium]|nr:hypothetical protein [Longimicrobiales bacterium]
MSSGARPSAPREGAAAARQAFIVCGRWSLPRVPAALLLAVTLWPSTASAQLDERTSVHLKNDCRRAAQILTRGEPDPLREWALQRIDACNESGGPVLAQVWAEPDEAELEQLYWTTAGFRDARVFDAVRAVAADVSQSTDVRLTALRVLAAYADRHLDPRLSDLKPSEDPEGPRLAYPGVGHRAQTEGAEPLPADHVDVTLMLLAELAEEDPDATVRFAAGRLRSWL